MLNGTYRYLIMCRICRFIVKKKRTNQYSNKIGQNTGTSNTAKKVAANPMQNALHDEYLRQHI